MASIDDCHVEPSETSHGPCEIIPGARGLAQDDIQSFDKQLIREKPFSAYPKLTVFYIGKG